MKTLTRMAIALMALVGLYLLLLTAVYAIPDALIEKNVDAALDVFETEGPYPHYFFDYPFGQADNNTDKEMFLNLITQEGASVLEAAMVPRYTRYWHGYAVFLRPLSVFLSIANLRYLNMILLALLLGLCFHKTADRLGLPTAIALLMGLMTTYPWLAPVNFQYFTVTALALVFSLAVLLGHGRQRFMASLPVVFLLFGSLVNFFDYLTFPVLSLGYPLLLLLLLERRTDPAHTFKDAFLRLLFCSLAWLAGYGLTWLMKGVCGTLFTSANVLAEIVENAFFRIDGTLPQGYKEAASAAMSIRYNLSAFFNPRNLAVFGLSAAGCALVAFRVRPKAKAWLTALPVLAVALYPYLWYSVLQNHSIMHCYFTFKAQGVTLFGLCAYFIAVSFGRSKPGEGPCPPAGDPPALPETAQGPD